MLKRGSAAKKAHRTPSGVLKRIQKHYSEIYGMINQAESMQAAGPATSFDKSDFPIHFHKAELLRCSRGSISRFPLSFEKELGFPPLMLSPEMDCMQTNEKLHKRNQYQSRDKIQSRITVLSKDSQDKLPIAEGNHNNSCETSQFCD